MKVGMLVCDLKNNGGATTHAIKLADALEKLHVEVDLIDGSDDFTTAFMAVLDYERGYDIVHVQGSPYRPVRKPKCPMVVTVHTLVSTEAKFKEHNWFTSRFGKWCERRTLSHADRVIIVNSKLDNEIANLHLKNRPATTFIPNGVDFEEFNGHALDRENFFMSAGRDIPRKDFATFRKACKKVNVPYAEFHDAPRKKLVDAYKTAKAFVCASHYETGPITMLEAMAAHCPTICTYEVSDDMTPARPPGMMFKAGDVEGLSFAIAKLNTYDKDYLKQMTDRAYEYIKDYSWDAIAKETLKVYEEEI